MIKQTAVRCRAQCEILRTPNPDKTILKSGTPVLLKKQVSYLPPGGLESTVSGAGIVSPAATSLAVLKHF